MLVYVSDCIMNIKGRSPPTSYFVRVTFIFATLIVFDGDSYGCINSEMHRLFSYSVVNACSKPDRFNSHDLFLCIATPLHRRKRALVAKNFTLQSSRRATKQYHGSWECLNFKPQVKNLQLKSWIQLSNRTLLLSSTSGEVVDKSMNNKLLSLF